MATVHPRLPGNMAASSASGSSLKRWITRHPVLSYLVVAYVVSWIIFVIPLLSRSGIGVLGFDAPPVEVFILAVAVFGLAGSPFLVTAIVDGRPGVGALASRYIRVRVGIQWYLFAIFGLLATALNVSNITSRRQDSLPSGSGSTADGRLRMHPLGVLPERSC